MNSSSMQIPLLGSCFQLGEPRPGTPRMAAIVSVPALSLAISSGSFVANRHQASSIPTKRPSEVKVQVKNCSSFSVLP